MKEEKIEYHNNKRFTLREETYIVVDAYDPYLCSVEDSHRESLGYYGLVDVEHFTDDKELNLTWMDRKDKINLRLSSNNVSDIKVNVDNLDNSHFYFEDKNKKINLKIYDNDSKEGTIKKLKIIRHFIKDFENVKSIEFEGFSSTMTSVLTTLNKKNGAQKIQKDKSKVKTK